MTNGGHEHGVVLMRTMIERIRRSTQERREGDTSVLASAYAFKKKESMDVRDTRTKLIAQDQAGLQERAQNLPTKSDIISIIVIVIVIQRALSETDIIGPTKSRTQPIPHVIIHGTPGCVFLAFDSLNTYEADQYKHATK